MGKNAENKKKSKFWIGYGIYMGILVVLLVVLLVNVWSIMKKYQAAQPERKMEELIERLEKGDVSDVRVASGSKFEPASDNLAAFSDMVKGKSLTYTVKSRTSDSMKYNIKDGEDVVAYAELTASNNRRMMFILAVSDWNLSGVEAVSKNGNKAVSIEVPDGYSVYVNGVMAGEEERTGEPVVVDGMEFVAEYVDAPKLITYQVKGLTEVPVVSVKDGNGNDIDMSLYTDYSDIKVSYQESDIPDDIKEYVITAAKDYSNFFSRDLQGCGESTACIQKYFPQGSYYIDLAEQYRTGDMWMYSGHQTPVFSNVDVREYTVYSDSCFSCRVIFDKTMILKNGETRTEHNDQVYYYVNIDGKWLIADMKS